MNAIAREYGSSSSEDEVGALPCASSCLKDARNTKDHEGRTRSFPHVEGDFATHVYVEVSVPSEAEAMLQEAYRRLQSAFLGLRWIEERHVSCSRTVSVRSTQKESLRRALSHALRRTKRFVCSFDGWDVYLNDDRTRTFFVLKMRLGKERFYDVIRSVDQAFRLHGLETYYSDPVPHLSVYWCLGDVVQVARERLRHVSTAIEWNVPVQRVVCKIGSHKQLISLPN